MGNEERETENRRRRRERHLIRDPVPLSLAVQPPIQSE